MPIRPDLRHFYDKVWRTITRPRILARAGDKCEQCGKPNHAAVWVFSPSREAGQYWTEEIAPVRAQSWRYCILGGDGNFRLMPPYSGARAIRVVLTIAHLNHISGDDRAENLKALCCWCHLNYDKLQHKQTRAARKDGRRPLLAPDATRWLEATK